MIPYETVATAVEQFYQLANANRETTLGCLFILAFVVGFLALHVAEKMDKKSAIDYDQIAKNAVAAPPGGLVKVDNDFDPKEIEDAIKKVIALPTVKTTVHNNKTISKKKPANIPASKSRKVKNTKTRPKGWKKNVGK